MFYLNLDENNYLLSVSKTNVGSISIESLDGLDLSGCRINAYQWNGEKLEIDKDRLAELEADEKAIDDIENLPSQLDRIEAQITFTAMMTDTLLEV